MYVSVFKVKNQKDRPTLFCTEDVKGHFPLKTHMAAIRPECLPALCPFCLDFYSFYSRTEG